MRKKSLYPLILFVYLSCKKEEVIVINPAAITTIELNIDQVVNDSTIVLKWSKFTGNNFRKYQLVRSATYFKNGQFGSFIEPVDSSNDVNHLSFNETNMPLARDIYYYLYAINDSMRIQAGAQVYYQRPNSLIYGIPTDVLIDKQQQKLYVTEEKKITIADYTSGRQINSKEFQSSIGFCSLASFNGSNELYVPANDGWLQILDAATLQLKDRIYVAGYGIGSVTAVNGKLYVSSSDMTQGIYSNCIKVYDRATKNLVGRTGYWDRTRLLPLEGTAVEMIDLTLNQIPVSLFYYQFSPGGIPLSKKEDSYHGDYPMDGSIVRSFPDGSRFITSSSGTIFNKSLVFERYVKQYGNYSDFAFNADGSIIYAAAEPQKKIDVVTYPSTTTVSSYPTAFYPYKIFRDGNILVCVSKANLNQQMSYIFIEKINL
ncbi:MAG: hypothetical protein ABI675_28195 [Chitinophagaceae bacterium]